MLVEVAPEVECYLISENYYQPLLIDYFFTITVLTLQYRTNLLVFKYCPSQLCTSQVLRSLFMC